MAFMLEQAWKSKLLKVMRATLFILIVCVSQIWAINSYSQNTRITLDLKNTSVKNILNNIQDNSEFFFIYDASVVDVQRRITIVADNKLIPEILDEIFSGSNVVYKIDDRQIALTAGQAGQAQQNRSVSGKVSDSAGVPLPGVTIVVKGTTNGTVTDAEGNYFLANIPEKATLLFSFVGMKIQEVNADGKTQVDVVMEEETIGIEEVVAIGYGTQKKSNVTGSVSSVKAERLTKISTSGTGEALQGLAPGLSVDFNDGSPGKSPELIVRGMTTWGSSNQPLVIIDGVPGDIQFLNPEDIKSMSILKDAATAAIYGSRSAAGVILIETNRGEKSKPKIRVSAYMGIDDMPKRMDICNSEEYIKVYKLALNNANISQEKWPKFISAYETNPAQFANTDWQNEYYRKGITKKFDIGYAAGSEASNISFTTYYSSTEGVIVETDAKKMGFRLNSDVTRGNFKVGESVSYGHMEDHPNISSGFPGMYQVSNILPLVSVYDETMEGGFGGAVPGLGMNDASNPVAFNKLIDRTNSADHIKVSGYMQYEFIKDLILKFQGSRSMDFSHYSSFTPTYIIGAYDKNEKAFLEESRGKEMNDLFELTLNYQKKINEHEFSGLLGASQEEYTFKDLSASATKFENNTLRLLVHGQENFAVGGNYYRSGLRSAFGRVSYNYGLKYLSMLSFRYDGSSKFGEGNKWGFFPSLSLGWNLSNEPFWEPIKSTVSAFKLKGSYGVLGNQSIGTYRYIPQVSYDTNNLNYSYNSDDISLGYAVTSLPSYSIRWEKTLYKNAGFDAAFLDNQLELSFEVYEKYTSDMLTEKPISSATGVSSFPIVNEGELKTTGWELQASYRNMQNKFKYDIDFNLWHYKSVLKKMADEGYLYETGPARTYVGGEIGEFWVFEAGDIFRSDAELEAWNKEHGYTDDNGVWNPLQPAAAPGDLRFVDQNGDGMLDSNDKIKVGSGVPDVTLGVNVNLYYGNFDLVANIYGDFGQKRYNFMKRQLQRADKNFNYGRDMLNSWTTDNTGSDIPRAVVGDPNDNNRLSTRYVENGDYIRLNNLQIGYTLPKSVAGNIGVDNLRFYVGGLKLLTLTKYEGYDPGMTGGIGAKGVDDALYPLSRTYLVGLQLTF
ncbi:TonB-linked outer membrane protein, SusC/RagA family [Mariniphaga anaerophila]|uniref:TonB-linked outer membrane protein, SusC/RagA family n=2 Tax=Mariniphaga anaerophila TaxID=1484053 RepID=A0A1M5F9P4_9BACT|nr:TonB-linked outer membrane protein, SusC/RagA family [Mariniphaga anaerophila]